MRHFCIAEIGTKRGVRGLGELAIGVPIGMHIGWLATWLPIEMAIGLAIRLAIGLAIRLAIVLANLSAVECDSAHTQVRAGVAKTQPGHCSSNQPNITTQHLG